jgi:hypothetical protein
MTKLTKTKIIEDDEIPDWDTSGRGGWVEEILTEDQRKKLIASQNKIWPTNFKECEKNVFLDGANYALNYWKWHKESVYKDMRPKEQRTQLNQAVAAIKKVKMQLGLLSGSPLTHANMAFMNARLLTVASDILWTKEDHGKYAGVGSLLRRTWLHLDDTQKILTSAAKRIPVSVSYRPENHINDCIVFHLARVWKANNGKYPACTKTSWFAKFIVELGEMVGLTLSLELAKSCIDDMKKTDKEYGELIKKSG